MRRDLGTPCNYPLPNSGQTGLENQKRPVSRLGQCQDHFPKQASLGTGKAKSSCSQLPAGQGMLPGEDALAWTSPEYQALQEPQPWQPEAGSPRSSHPLRCS